jgi:hypothetical protein
MCKGIPRSGSTEQLSLRDSPECGGGSGGGGSAMLPVPAAAHHRLHPTHHRIRSAERLPGLMAEEAKKVDGQRRLLLLLSAACKVRRPQIFLLYNIHVLL